MGLTADQQRVKALLTETITLLCKNGLHFKSEFCIEALIGITLDQDDIFLVSIKETVKSDSSKKLKLQNELSVPEALLHSQQRQKSNKSLQQHRAYDSPNSAAASTAQGHAISSATSGHNSPDFNPRQRPNETRRKRRASDSCSADNSFTSQLKDIADVGTLVSCTLVNTATSQSRVTTDGRKSTDGHEPPKKKSNSDGTVMRNSSSIDLCSVDTVTESVKAEGREVINIKEESFTDEELESSMQSQHSYVGYPQTYSNDDGGLGSSYAAVYDHEQHSSKSFQNSTAGYLTWNVEQAFGNLGEDQQEGQVSF